MTTATLYTQTPDGRGEQLDRATWAGPGSPVHTDTGRLLRMRPLGTDANTDPAAWFDALEAWGSNGYRMVEVERA